MQSNDGLNNCSVFKQAILRQVVDKDHTRFEMDKIGTFLDSTKLAEVSIEEIELGISGDVPNTLKRSQPSLKSREWLPEDIDDIEDQ